MRRRNAVLAVVLEVVVATGVVGQAPVSSTLLTRCGAIRVELMLGRLVLIPQHRGQYRLAHPPADSSSDVELTETLVVNNDEQAPLMRFERDDERGSVTIEILHWKQVSIVREDRAGKVLEFHQPAQGDIRWLSQQNGERRERRAPSLWHLLLTEPRSETQELLSLLSLVRRDWHLAGMTERLESELFESALSRECICRESVSRLIRELDSVDFQRRQSADRQLRACGPAVLAHLQCEPGQRWSREQRARIERIRDNLSTSAVDTPARVAQWLGEDEQVWLALLKHADPQRRHVAALRLAAMHPEGIHFDPYGEEAYRQEQLAQLRLKFGE